MTHGEAKRGGEETSEAGQERNSPLRQHCESAHLAESCAAAAATDPPTPTGDEKGRENERRERRERCRASRLCREREKEGEEREECKGRGARRGLGR